jgi:hypothetical protein
MGPDDTSTPQPDTDSLRMMRRTFVGASVAVSGAVAALGLLDGCSTDSDVSAPQRHRCGVPVAIANAVYNATGRRITDLPVTIEQLL